MTHLNTDNRSFLADELGIEAGLDGRCTISIRGAAKLLGVSYESIRKKLVSPVNLRSLEPLQDAKNPVNLSDQLMFPESATIDDQTFAELVIWYSAKSPQRRTKEAKELLTLTAAIGVRAWLQTQAGYDGKTADLVKSVEVDRLEMDAAIDEAVLERLTEVNRIRTLAQAKLKSEYDRGLETLADRIRDLDAEVKDLRDNATGSIILRGPDIPIAEQSELIHLRKRVAIREIEILNAETVIKVMTGDLVLARAQERQFEKDLRNALLELQDLRYLAKPTDPIECPDPWG
jgi:cell division protein FtsB